MPKFKEPKVKVKFISNCFEVMIFLEFMNWAVVGVLKRRANELHACTPIFPLRQDMGPVHHMVSLFTSLLGDRQ